MALLATVVAGTVYAWRHWGTWALARVDTRLAINQIQVTPQPPWLLADVKSEVFRDGSLGELTLLDRFLTYKVSHAFEVHAWVAKVDPFLMKRPSQFRTDGPFDLDSRAYAREYKEVKDFGGNGTTTPTLRTPEQTATAMFFTANPVEMYNRTFRTIAQDRELSLVEQARLFASLNLAGADAAIGCWDDKAHWSFWRPITAIQQGDNDGNRRTEGDPTWNSLVPSPPYPDHPSGYNCATGSFMHTAKSFFGRDRVSFSLVGPGATGATRNYQRFTDVIDDTIDARIWLGIHFRAPDVQGAELGEDVARWLNKHFLEPRR